MGGTEAFVRGWQAIPELPHFLLTLQELQVKKLNSSFVDILDPLHAWVLTLPEFILALGI